MIDKLIAMMQGGGQKSPEFQKQLSDIPGFEQFVDPNVIGTGGDYIPTASRLSGPGATPVGAPPPGVARSGPSTPQPGPAQAGSGPLGGLGDLIQQVWTGDDPNAARQQQHGAKVRNRQMIFQSLTKNGVPEEQAFMLSRSPEAATKFLFGKMKGTPNKNQIKEIYVDGKKQTVLIDPHTGDYKPIGGPAPGKVADAAKPPAGWRYIDPADPRKGVEEMPGYKKPIPAEVAGKVALIQTAMKGLGSATDVLTKDWSMWQGVQSLMAGQSTVDLSTLTGEVGRATRQVSTAIESALRAMTGAAAPPAELAQYTRLFLPGAMDDANSAKQKLQNLTEYLSKFEQNALVGRGDTKAMTLEAAGDVLRRLSGGAATRDPVTGAASGVTVTGPGQTPGGKPTVIRKFNPATGKIE